MGRPKYISGLSAFVDDGLGIVISYARDHNYDRIVDIEDLSGDLETVGYPTVSYEIGRVTISYGEILNGVNTRKLRIVFESGESTEIDVFVPTHRQKVGTGGLYLQSELNGLSNFFNFTQRLQEGPLKSTNPAAYAMMPIKDPYKRFGHDGAWSYSEDGCLAVFNSQQYERLDRSVPFLGRPAGEKGVQFAQFVAVLGEGGNYTKAEEVWENALASNNSQTVFSFVWTKDLEQITDGELKRIEVCADPTSPSYYRTTGLDSEGNAIESYYLDGSKQCIFYPGACAIDPSKFKVYVIVNNTIEGGDGRIAAAVVSNDATPPKDAWIDRDAYAQDKYPSYPPIDDSDFQFDLVQPTGIGGTLTSGVVNENIWTFGDLKDSLVPYTVQVTDVATGNKAEIPVRVTPADTDTTASGDCSCGDEDAINYDGSGSGIKCGCVDCTTGELIVNGQPAGHPFMEVQNISSIPETIASAEDGAISFSSEIHSNIFNTIDPFISPASYDIYLYSVTGYGAEPTGGPVQSYPGEPSNDVQFNDLPSGWYAIKINLTGQACVTTFWTQVGLVQEKVPCEAAETVSIAIDPCTGTVTGSVDTEYEYQIGFSTTGSSFFPSITVSSGDTLYIRVDFPNAIDCTELILEPYTVTDSDLNCATTDQTVGCTDPTALNYDPQATIDAGTCIYGRLGCTNASAVNYDPMATEDDGSCFDCPSDMILVVILNGSSEPTILWADEPSSYTAEWTNLTTGNSYTTTVPTTPEPLDNGAWVLVVTDSFGCTDTHVFGVVTDLYFGCTDPLATNFQPGANVPYSYYEGSGTVLSENCEYRINQSKCIPKTLKTILEGIQKCISRKSNEFVNNMKAGRLTECNTNEFRILDLIYYLLQQRGLDCLFNCQDSQTPEPDFVSCISKWQQGGTSGGELIYSNSQSYVWGDVVQSPDTGYIYIVTSEAPIKGVNPEEPGNTDKWKVCNDTFPPADVVNRLDPFLAKVKDICLDCGINIEQPVETESVPLEDNGTSIGGSEISISGDAVDLS